MKKTIIIAALAATVFMLSACGQLGRDIATLTGHHKSCVGGVVYLQFASGVTVAYNPDGTIQTCRK